MSNLSKIFTILLICLMAITGCKKKPKAQPGDTVMGPDGYEQSDDYIDPTIYEGSGMLPERITSLDGIDASKRVSNLMPSVFFDYDQAFVRQDERAKLKQVFDYLTDNPTHRLIIEGYCDWRGTTEYNLALGDRRAISVKNYLTQLGIDESRIAIVSKGDLESVEEGSDSQMQEDRRADLIILLP